MPKCNMCFMVNTKEYIENSFVYRWDSELGGSFENMQKVWPPDYYECVDHDTCLYRFNILLRWSDSSDENPDKDLTYWVWSNWREVF